MPPELAVPASPADVTKAGSPPVDGGGAAPAAAGAGPESEGLRNLRTAYDGLKKNYEPWEKLGLKPEQVTQFKGVHESFFNRTAELAKQLNYDEAEVQEEFLKDPYGTLQFLEQEAAKATRDTDPAAKFKADLDKRVAPLEKRLQAQDLKEANARFDGEFDRLFAESFKDAKFEASTEADLLYDAAAQLFRMDREALGRLREGKVSDVAKYFNEAKGMLDAYYLARANREGGVSSAPGGKKGEEGGKRKFKIDDIIEDAGVLGPQYKQ